MENQKLQTAARAELWQQRGAGGRSIDGQPVEVLGYAGDWDLSMARALECGKRRAGSLALAAAALYKVLCPCVDWVQFLLNMRWLFGQDLR